jgi:FAD binding domain
MMRFLFSRYSTTAGLAASSSSGAFRRTARGTAGSSLHLQQGQQLSTTAAASAAAAAVTSSSIATSSSTPPPRRAGRPEEKWCHDGDTTTKTIVHSELLAVFSHGDDDREECGVSTNPYELRQHGQDESYHTPASPDFVVYPKSIEHIQGILAIGRKYRVPIIPFGAGTSVEGHINALRGGISLGTYTCQE